MAALDAATTARVMVLLETPPADGKYIALKTFLLKLFELSDLEKADRPLSLNGLSDSKPSELMERMLAVLGSADLSFLCTVSLPDHLDPAPAANVRRGCVIIMPGLGPRPNSVTDHAVLRPTDMPGSVLVSSYGHWTRLQAVVYHLHVVRPTSAVLAAVLVCFLGRHSRGQCVHRRAPGTPTTAV